MKSFKEYLIEGLPHHGDGDIISFTDDGKKEKGIVSKVISQGPNRGMIDVRLINNLVIRDDRGYAFMGPVYWRINQDDILKVLAVLPPTYRGTDKDFEKYNKVAKKHFDIIDQRKKKK
jgi:hypothetical protein